jgi:3-hydroxyisobutyrate dehydrogenase
MRVGFAGLGRMGARMARNLVAAGHDVSVWNRSPGPAEAFGGPVAGTPRALAEGAEVVITMLADDAASVAVHDGRDGLFAAERGARTFVEMGTMSPDHLSALRAAAGSRQVIDAPVSGATQAAENAQLMIMVGADAATAAPLMPLFDAMGRRTICLDQPGAGAVMKLAVNSLIHGLNQTVSEALTLAEAAGIAPERAFDVIEASAAAAPMLGYRRLLYLDEKAHEVTFTVALARKDMEVTAQVAEGLGVALPQGRLNLDQLREAASRGYAARDMASMVDFLREGRT